MEELKHVVLKIQSATEKWACGMSLQHIRRDFEALLSYPTDAEIEPTEIADIPACRLLASNADPKRVILFCHGGGYQIGSTRSHLALMSRLSAASSAAVVGFDYRLAPEHRFPAAIDDGHTAYRWLLSNGYRGVDIAISGDSAGGGLAVATALRVRETGEALPACLALVSPWLDLTMRGESYRNRAHLDIFSQPEQLQAMARTYLGRDGHPSDPLASPVNADLSAMPPTLIHAGDHDITLDDSVLFARLAREQGVSVSLKVWPEMMHHFQVFEELPQARQSVSEIGTFIRTRFEQLRSASAAHSA